MSTGATFFFFLLLPPFYGAALPAFLAPVTKDLATHKYMLSVYLSTPPKPVKLLLDLGASTTLVDCTYNSSSSTHASIRSSSCRDPNSCLGNSATQTTPGQPVSDSLSMPVTNGVNPGQLGQIPGFVFSCTNRSSLKGLAKGSSGSAGLGRSNLSLPAQVSNHSSENVFALCLSGSPSAPGVAFFGSTGPYYFHRGIDLSKDLNYTQFLPNPAGSRSGEYFIGLKSLKINGRAIDFNRTLPSRLSTTSPYTVLQRTIFAAVTEAFANESAALNLTMTDPVKPFGVCYRADEVASTHLGPAVPAVDFVLQDGAVWRMFGSNSMVRVYGDGSDVWCLGFVDGGARPATPIVIGGHQMEDNLLRFDIGSGRLGFSSSVLARGTMCANFNFTTRDHLFHPL